MLARIIISCSKCGYAWSGVYDDKLCGDEGFECPACNSDNTNLVEDDDD